MPRGTVLHEGFQLGIATAESMTDKGLSRVSETHFELEGTSLHYPPCSGEPQTGHRIQLWSYKCKIEGIRAAITPLATLLLRQPSTGLASAARPH